MLTHAHVPDLTRHLCVLDCVVPVQKLAGNQCVRDAHCTAGYQHRGPCKVPKQSKATAEELPADASKYEKDRAANMAANQSFLDSIGLSEFVASSRQKPPAASRKRSSKDACECVPPQKRRQSGPVRAGRLSQ